MQYEFVSQSLLYSYNHTLLVLIQVSCVFKLKKNVEKKLYPEVRKVFQVFGSRLELNKNQSVQEHDRITKSFTFHIPAVIERP